MDTMIPPAPPASPPSPAPSSPSPAADAIDGLRTQLRTLIILMSVLVFIAGSFFGWSLYRQNAIKNCVTENTTYSGIGVGDMVGCMTLH
jgi:hypothetical protein